jgi:hypothetical protein
MSHRDGLLIEAFTMESAEYGSTLTPIMFQHVEVDRRQLGGGDDHGVIVVSINVDDDFDKVTVDLGQTGDMAALDRALETLSAVRDELARVYGNRPRRLGRCLETGDNGRCTYRLGHESDHAFPTDEELEAELRVVSAVRQAG